MKQSKLSLKLGRSLLSVIAFIFVALLIIGLPVSAQEGTPQVGTLPNIVLVHGAYADGSSWSTVIQRLQAAGYNVIAPQMPHTSLPADLAVVRHVLSMQNGPTIIAGHSYGGQVITALSTNAPHVVGLVYIAAFAIDQGEAISALQTNYPPAPALAHVKIDDQGLSWIPEDDYVTYFASGIDPIQAKIMYATQQPLAASTFQEVLDVPPSWKSLPSWYLVGTQDEAIPPDLERMFAKRMGATTVEVASGHVAMVSHPDEVAKLIEDAATATSK